MALKNAPSHPITRRSVLWDGEGSLAKSLLHYYYGFVNWHKRVGHAESVTYFVIRTILF